MPWFCLLCGGEDSAGSVQPGMFNCVCLNARGIVSKTSDLMAYLSAHHVDILSVTETFLNPDVLNFELCPPGCIVFQQDRDRHGGGVMILIRDNLVVHRCWG